MRVNLTEYDPKRHRDYITSKLEGGTKIENPHSIKGIRYVFTLEISRTLLVFKDIAQLQEAKLFFENNIRPSTAAYRPPFEHEYHFWFGRLPKRVLKASNKEKILKAINKALDEYAKTYSV